MRKVHDVALPQGVNRSAIKPDRVRADLLVVANNNDLAGDVLQEQRLWSRLARFVDDCNVEKVGGRLSWFLRPDRSALPMPELLRGNTRGDGVPASGTRRHICRFPFRFS